MECKTVTCIGCPMGCEVTVSFDANGEIAEVAGNTCKRGDDYARNEVTHPMRIVTSIVRINNGVDPMLSVKTSIDIPKDKIFDCMKEINAITAEVPVKTGDILLEHVCGTEANIVATKDIETKTS